MKAMQLILLVAGAIAAAVSVSCAPVQAPPEGKNTPEQPTAPVAVKRRTSPADAELDNLRPRIEAAIEQVKQRDLLTTNGFWTVFHGILGLGPSVTLFNPETGKRTNALDYIAAGGEVRGLRFVPTRTGIDVETRPGTFISQGHQDQFVAEMVQWGVSPEKKFIVDGQEYTFRDFIRHSQMRASVKGNQELEWALIIIGQHVGTDAAWTNAHGEPLRFEDLVRKELDKSVEAAACGGTHLLFGLSWVYHLHLKKGGKTDGIWKDVADHAARYKERARKLQNPSGAFSTDFFKAKGDAADMQLRLNTSGHIFEWLALALTDDELDEPWVRLAAAALAQMFLEIKSAPMEGGTLYHAVHGLLIYYGRVFGPEKLGPLAPHVPLLPGSKVGTHTARLR
jgi:hypothetical protein